ncbi:MAG: hypothetical protein ABSF83_09745 [Nitrososphaerales archaeon]|jgi:hypothetical protein
MVGLSDVVTVLSAISSIAVIAGAGFVIVQLRQNGALLRASLRQERKDAAFSMLERLTNESFAKRRANFYKVIEKYRADDWAGFDDSPEDFEVRNFAYQYELYGQMVRDDLIDFSMVAEMLQYVVVTDWKVFEPVSEHFKERWGVRVSPWHNFQRLSERSEKYLSKRDAPSRPQTVPEP